MANERSHATAPLEFDPARVAAAFGIQNPRDWRRYDHVRAPKIQCSGVVNNSVGVSWIYEEDGRLTYFAYGESGYPHDCIVGFDYRGWGAQRSLTIPKFNTRMAHALYRLGIQDEQLLGDLNCPLTAHEKLELRLSMPREFWPPSWGSGHDH